MNCFGLHSFRKALFFLLVIFLSCLAVGCAGGSPDYYGGGTEGSNSHIGRNVQGVVVDESGFALSGVEVRDLLTEEETTTNANGEFQLMAGVANQQVSLEVEGAFITLPANETEGLVLQVSEGGVQDVSKQLQSEDEKDEQFSSGDPLAPEVEDSGAKKKRKGKRGEHSRAEQGEDFQTGESVISGTIDTDGDGIPEANYYVTSHEFEGEKLGKDNVVIDEQFSVTEPDFAPNPYQHVSGSGKKDPREEATSASDTGAAAVPKGDKPKEKGSYGYNSISSL